MENNEYVGKLIQMLRRVEIADLFMDKKEFTRTEFRMLREIATERANGREIISSELARRLGVTRSAISQIAAKLEERGVIERVPSPVDKKIAYVRLSGRSLAAYEEQCAAAAEVIGKVVEKLGTEKMDAFFAANEEFYDALDEVCKTARSKGYADR